MWHYTVGRLAASTVSAGANNWVG